MEGQGGQREMLRVAGGKRPPSRVGPAALRPGTGVVPGCSAVRRSHRSVPQRFQA